MAEKSLSQIDSNMLIETKIDQPGIKFYNIESEPFRIYGVKRVDGIYRRLPECVAESVSPVVHSLHACTTGGRVRFVTDSPYVAIHAEYDSFCIKDHMPSVATSGFDMYRSTLYTNTLPPGTVPDTKSSDKLMPDLGREMKLVTVNFPLFASVKDLYIGVDENAVIERAPDYSLEKPVVFYGSSITHGACASRPGMSYPAILSRKLDFNFINLGFAGGAKGEREMAEYIAGLDMSMFVYDYDHNAHTDEILEETHERMFKIIREKHPDMPILIMSMPVYRNVPWVRHRQEIIQRTCDNARANGDRNVWFIPGTNLIREELGEDFSVDGCHPTDLGFFSMATSIKPVFEMMLKKYRGERF